MKTLKKIKLNQLSKAELENRELINLRGGYNCFVCTCGCPGKGLRTNQLIYSTLEKST